MGDNFYEAGEKFNGNLGAEGLAELSFEEWNTDGKVGSLTCVEGF